MQELGPPLHKVASLFAIQFLFLNFSVVFQLLKGQASKQGPERLCGFHPCTQNSLGQDAEQNYLILCALSWAAGLETSREPFQPEFLYESATLPTCAAGITAAGVQHRGGGGAAVLGGVGGTAAAALGAAPGGAGSGLGLDLGVFSNPTDSVPLRGPEIPVFLPRR